MKAALFLFLLPFVAQAFPQRDILPGKFIVKINEDHLPITVAQDHGIKPSFVYTKAFHGFAAEFPEEVFKRLTVDARIEFIEPDKIVRANEEDFYAVSWGLDRIDQRALPLDGVYNHVSTGSGVTAYVIDTGIRYDHSEFAGRASLGFDAVGTDGADCHGHGTHVSGTIAGTTYGVAKDVVLKAVRVLDCDGSGSLSGVMAGVDWVTGNRKLPAVANLSLGLNGASASLDTAIQNMINAGVATAIAAGNENQDACNTSPGRVASAMTIGATGKTDAKSSFSNWGNCVDWFAPGESIESSWNTGPYDTKVLNGTSMATPHTTGVAALYLQKHPSSTPAQVRDALFGMTTKGIVTGPNTSSNHLLYSLEATTPPADTLPPMVNLTRPSNGDRIFRWTFVAMEANAFDNVKVVSVKFYIDNTLICTDTTAPYGCNWRLPFFPKPTYTIKAKAYDAAGNEGVSQTVTIRSI